MQGSIDVFWVYACHLLEKTSELDKKSRKELDYRLVNRKSNIQVVANLKYTSLRVKGKETLNCQNTCNIKGHKMPFNLFRKKKEPEQETAHESLQEPLSESSTPAEQETSPETRVPVETSTVSQPQTSVPPVEQKVETASETIGKTYLKAMPLKELSDVEKVKSEVINGNIIILRVTPLAGKNIEDVKSAVNELFQFAESMGGDIARLGEERVVICPKSIRIWREKTPAPVSNESLPTAA